MKANNVINYLGDLVRKLEPQYTIRLMNVIYSEEHGHEICLLQQVGKNTFMKCTADEILTDPQTMQGLSAQDAVTISRLDQSIRECKNTATVVDIDRNGTILLRDNDGDECRYPEKLLSSERDLLNTLNADDAHDLGYRVGFREGLAVHSAKKQAAGYAKSGVSVLDPLSRV